MAYTVYAACISNVGHYRENNEDNFCFADRILLLESKTEFPLILKRKRGKAFCLAVFDGMGGEERGEEASRLAAERARSWVFDKDIRESLKSFVVEANRDICDFAVKNSIRSTGTTVAMLAFARKKIWMMNLGDSPVFRLSKDELTQISVDDVTVSFGNHKPPLTQSLGIPEDELILAPHILELPYKNGDRYVICSDGLTDMLDREQIKALLKKGSEAATSLVQAALDAGGKDNVTVITVTVKHSLF